MTSPHIVRYGATALVSSAAGWLMNAAEPTPNSAVHPVAAASRPADATAATAPPTAAPLIAVASDGNVTLRVEQQPLEWVLEQIAKQSGWLDVRLRAGATPASAERPILPPATERCAETRTLKPAVEAHLLQKIEHGNEADRYGGLLQARSEGIAVPDTWLKSWFETDASERVRMLAFETYLDQRSESDNAVRVALEAAQYVPDAAIRRIAKQWLEDLLETKRLDAADEPKV